MPTPDTIENTTIDVLACDHTETVSVLAMMPATPPSAPTSPASRALGAWLRVQPAATTPRQTRQTGEAIQRARMAHVTANHAAPEAPLATTSVLVTSRSDNSAAMPIHAAAPADR